MSVSEHRLITHNPRQSEVTQFDVLISIKEYISWFEISVQNFVTFFASVTLKQRQCELSKYLPDELFRDIS